MHARHPKEVCQSDKRGVFNKAVDNLYYTNTMHGFLVCFAPEHINFMLSMNSPHVSMKQNKVGLVDRELVVGHGVVANV